MGKRKSYEPGAFCWTNLRTTDPSGAKAFYGELFGWQAEDIPVGKSSTHTMLNLDGEHVAALNEVSRPEREQGVPAHWLSYVSVESADKTAERAKELGGQVWAPSTCSTTAGKPSSWTPLEPCSPSGSRANISARAA